MTGSCHVVAKLLVIIRMSKVAIKPAWNSWPSGRESDS